MLGGGDLLIGFLPGLAGGDEDHRVEAETVGYLAGGDEVTVMDGVKGAAHDADALRTSHGW